MSWSQVLAPAIEYAERGFIMTPRIHRAFSDPETTGAARYPEGARLFYKEGKAWPVGELIRQPELAETFRAIAQGGPQVFYGGALAERFADYFQQNGGILTTNDFSEYRARWSEPLSTEYRDFTVYSQPPGSGGMTVLQALNILEEFDLRALEHDDPEFIHLLAETLKLAFVDDDAHNTGKDYARIPLERLLSQEYARQQAARIDRSKAQFYPAARTATSEQPEDTTNHTVVDRDHNVVTMTQTSMFPMVTVPGTGVIFNSGMTYFSLDPKDINYIEGGQRPRFVMSPTIVLRHGEPYFALGAAGGWTINQTVLQVILRVLDFGMDAHEAVSAPRVVLRYLRNSIPYLPGTELDLEDGIEDPTRAAVAAKGHRLLQPGGRFGMLNAILIYPRSGVLSGGADPREEGLAAGW
jgi:gamma-glutamyltranspeptidase/glutathione hydrolase